MGNGVDLLKMLEPTVRPGGLQGPTKAGGAQGPIETRSFESLLNEATGGDSQDTGTGNDGAVQGVTGSKKADPLQALSQLGQIENPALRRLMGGEK